MTIITRTAISSDRETCIGFINRLNEGPILKSWHTTFTALISGKRGSVYVAEDTDLGVIGIASVSFNLAIRYGGEYCQLEELYVDPKSRGRNCGGLLLDAVIEGAQKRGCVEVGLYIAHQHAANQPFYEKYGFKDVGVEVRQKLSTG